MAKILKWVGIVAGGLIVLIIVLLLIVPQFVDINKYKPKIESMVSESTGRSFSIGGDIDLSLFPWAGVALSDMHLGNAKGFQEKDFVSVEHFEVRVKLLPLVFRDFQVKRFVLKRPRIVLEKDKRGHGNWEDLVKPEKKEKREKRVPAEKKPPFAIKDLMVGEFAITSGELVWIDHQKGGKQRLMDLNLVLEKISLDQPIGLDLTARLNGQPLEVEAEVGPLGRPPGEGEVPILLNVRALDAVVAQVKGFLADLSREPQFNMALEVQPFSPRKLAEVVGVDLSNKTTDPEVLKEMSLKTTLTGTTKAVTLRDGRLKLDDSTLKFNLDAKEFEKPALSFNLDLDMIDIDRYLPPPAEEEKKGKKKGKPGTDTRKKETEKPDYTPLRKLVMDGTVRIERLKVRGANVADVMMKINAKNGIIRLDPFSMNLYKGSLSGKVKLNVQKDTPKVELAQHLEGVQAGPLLKDLGYTDRFEGLANFKADLGARGTGSQEIKKTLNGSGEFAFTDGAIVGIDIAQLVRNVSAALGLGEREKPRTEFSELKGNFTIKNGLIDNPITYLASPLLRVVGKGKVHLARETIDYRVEPEFVGTMTGQADTKQRSGLMVPVEISGTFSKPKFRADLRAIVESETLKKEASKLVEELTEGKEGDETASKQALKLLEDLAKGEEGKEGGLEKLIPGLFGSKKKK